MVDWGVAIRAHLCVGGLVAQLDFLDRAILCHLNRVALEVQRLQQVDVGQGPLPDRRIIELYDVIQC